MQKPFRSACQAATWCKCKVSALPVALCSLLLAPPNSRSSAFTAAYLHKASKAAMTLTSRPISTSRSKSGPSPLPALPIGKCRGRHTAWSRHTVCLDLCPVFTVLANCGFACAAQMLDGADEGDRTQHAWRTPASTGACLDPKGWRNRAAIGRVRLLTPPRVCTRTQSLLSSHRLRRLQHGCGATSAAQAAVAAHGCRTHRARRMRLLRSRRTCRVPARLLCLLGVREGGRDEGLRCNEFFPGAKGVYYMCSPRESSTSARVHNIMCSSPLQWQWQC